MGNRKGYVKASVSQSFTEGEVDFLDQLLAVLRRGGDVKVLQRHEHFGALCRKTHHMKERIRELKKKRESLGLSGKTTEDE